MEITDINSEGAGVGRLEGKAVFVPGTLVGEQVDIEIEKDYPRYARGRLLGITQPSPKRITPVCPAFLRCGGCSFLHMPYSLQLETKRKIVADALQRIGGQEIAVDPVVPCQKPLHYRNKASFPVCPSALGYYAPGSHRIVDLDGCPLTDPRISALLPHVKGWAMDSGLSHLVIRAADDGIMVILVFPRKGMVQKEEAVSLLAPLGVDSIYLNINPGKTILSDRMTWIYGKKALTQEVCGNRFPVSPLSFFQVNTAQCRVLYDLALSALDYTGKRVVDAYCGVGTMTLALAQKAAAVIGVEEVPAAVENAKAAAKTNGVENVRFVREKCERYLPQLLKTEPVDAILLDPPRGGLKPAVIEAIAQCGIADVVYVSCSPQTLARDTARFREAGYTVVRVTPVDMFPQTPEVECVCVLRKERKKQS